MVSYMSTVKVRLISGESSPPPSINRRRDDWFHRSHHASTGARGKREYAVSCRNGAHEGCAVRLKWRFIVTKLARLRAASHTEDRNAAVPSTFPLPLRHKHTDMDLMMRVILSPASTIYLNISFGLIKAVEGT